MNTTAVVMWALFAGIGFLAGDVSGMITGLVIGLGISFVADIIYSLIN